MIIKTVERGTLRVGILRQFGAMLCVQTAALMASEPPLLLFVFEINRLFESCHTLKSRICCEVQSENTDVQSKICP